MIEQKEPIGKIVIYVYEHGQTVAEFSGKIPTNAITMSKVTIQRGYSKYIQELSVLERKEKLEKDRVTRQEDLKRKEQKATEEAERLLLEAKKDAKKVALEEEKEEIKNIPSFGLNAVDLRKKREDLKSIDNKIKEMEK